MATGILCRWEQSGDGGAAAHGGSNSCWSLLVVGAAYFAYTLIRGPAEDNVSVYTIASSGDGDEQLVAEGRDPAWSPDGQTLALTLPGDTSDEIGVIEIGGTEATCPRRWLRSGLVT